MKIEYVLSKEDKEIIDKCKERIEEIKQSYIDTYENQPFRRRELRKRFMNDASVLSLEKRIANIYDRSVVKYVVIAESEEDKERLRRLAEGQGWSVSK